MVFVYGDDMRQSYLADMFEEADYPVTRISLSQTAPTLEAAGDISDPDVHAEQEILVFPIPAPPELYHMLLPFLHRQMILLGGNIPEEVFQAGKQYGTKIFDYMKVPSVPIKNAVATAEGAICEAIKLSPVTIAGSKCLVAGYGNCGSVLCQKLLALQAEVFILETDIVKQVEAIVAGCQTEFSSPSQFDYIFNTVPSPVFDSTFLEEVPTNCVIIDIASKPGGTDFDYCALHNIPAKLVPGLPAKYAPKSAASILFENIKVFLRRNHVTICRPSAQTMQK